MLYLAAAIPFDVLTEAGAVGIALLLVAVVSLAGREALREGRAVANRMLDMMNVHITHLNAETDKHTELLQKQSSILERQAAGTERAAGIAQRTLEVLDRHTVILTGMVENGKRTGRRARGDG